MLNFINIYSFIPVSGCVGMGPSVLLCPGAYNAVKMALSFSNFKFSIPTNVGEENSKLKKNVCLILLSLFKQYNMFELTYLNISKTFQFHFEKVYCVHRSIIKYIIFLRGL
jgi:hypothetical protein